MQNHVKPILTSNFTPFLMVKLLCLMFTSKCLLAKPSFMVKPHVLYFLMAQPHFLRLQNPAFFMVKVSKNPLSWWFNLIKHGETLNFAGWKASANARTSRWPPQHCPRLASEKRTSGGEKEKKSQHVEFFLVISWDFIRFYGDFGVNQWWFSRIYGLQ